MYQGHTIEPVSSDRLSASPAPAARVSHPEWEYNHIIAQAHVLRGRIVREMLSNLWHRVRAAATGKNGHDTSHPGAAFDHR